MKDCISFIVLGRPETQGSIRAFMIKGKPRLTSDNAKLKPWRQQLGWMALANRPTDNIWAGRHEPVSVEMLFYFKPPKKLPKGRPRPSVKPDVDKLQRAVFDAMSGILYVDDGQIVGVHAAKFYGFPERMEFTMVKVT